MSTVAPSSLEKIRPATASLAQVRRYSRRAPKRSLMLGYRENMGEHRGVSELSLERPTRQIGWRPAVGWTDLFAIGTAGLPAVSVNS